MLAGFVQQKRHQVFAYHDGFLVETMKMEEEKYIYSIA